MDRVAKELFGYILEQHELEGILLKYFHKWVFHACQCLKVEEIKKIDWIDEFSKDVRKSLLELKYQNRLAFLTT